MAAKVDYAYNVLVKKNKPHTIDEIIKGIKSHIDIEGNTQEIADLYTEMCTDGRFIVLEDQTWDLRTNYSLKEIEEEVTKRMVFEFSEEEIADEIDLEMTTTDDQEIAKEIKIDEIIDGEDLV